MKQGFLSRAIIGMAILISVSACNGVPQGTIQQSNNGPLGTIVGMEPGTGIFGGHPGPSSPPVIRAFNTDVLLFAGSGTWGAEVSSLEDILTNHGATYKKVNSEELDGMSSDELAQFGAIIIPGGKGDSEANSLSAATHARLRAAVQDQGLGYVGFCAGAFIAFAPAPQPGQDVSYGLGVADGPILDYYHLQNEGTDIAMTLESFPDGKTRDILWYGGPITPNSGVIAKYPDGTPAISQAWSKNGLVVVSGPHPTATESTLAALGVSSSDGIHLDLAWDLINAAVHQRPMQSF